MRFGLDGVVVLSERGIAQWMGYPLSLARRYLGLFSGWSLSRTFAAILAVLGVTSGVGLLTVVMSVMSGFVEQFRDKVLGVNAHVLVLKRSIDFREYRDVMQLVRNVPGVKAAAPFVIDPMMVSHGTRTATGVLLKGVDPELMPQVLDLPKHITEPKGFVEAGFPGLRLHGAAPPQRIPFAPTSPDTPSSSSGAVAPASAPSGSEDLPSNRDPLLLEIKRSIEGSRERKNEKSVQNAQAEKKKPLIVPEKKIVAKATTEKKYEPSPDAFDSELPDIEEIPPSIATDMCNSPDKIAQLPGAIVGTSLARQLSLNVGDCIQVMSPTVGSAFTAGSRTPLTKPFRVIAFFEAGFDQYDSKLIYTDIYAAQEFYEYGDSVTGVEMRIDDVDHSLEVAQEIEKRLNNTNYQTMDWRELNRSLFEMLEKQRLGFSIPWAVLIIIAGFQVVATLTMLGLEKRKEVAVIKAMGATNWGVMRVFLIQGAFFGVFGAVLGSGLAFLTCKVALVRAFPLDPKVYFISHLPVKMDPKYFAITSGFAVLICLVASILPAINSALLRPADGLRSE